MPAEFVWAGGEIQSGTNDGASSTSGLDLHKTCTIVAYARQAGIRLIVSPRSQTITYVTHYTNLDL
jgi:hypothetical protein